MPTTTLPEHKEKAHEIARRITNERPPRKRPDTPESNVTGGFNQKRRDGAADEPARDTTDTPREDGQ